VGVTSVQFNVDGTSIGSLSSAPYTTTWNSGSVADGSHTLTVTAQDAAGNTTTSAGVAITVRNTPPIITAIASSSIASTTQTITWTTDELATSTVYYGTTTSYGSASSSAILTTSHSITLTGLTASTTYNFVVTSADASGNIASSTNQSFTTAAYTYYVDSVNGSDANPGTSPSLALRNITALPTITAGQGVGLAYGSHWRQQLTINAANATVIGYPTTYNSTNLPILDASDVIPNANFVAATGGNTGAYYTNSALSFLSAGSGAGWINVFETGGPGDSTTGRFLTNVVSEALVASTPCSYYVPGISQGSAVPASGVIYLHSCDDSSPITNGYLYEFSNRATALTMNGYGGKVSNLEGRKNSSESGAIVLSGDGNSYIVNNIIARDGNDHVMFVPSGTTISNSQFINAYWGPNIFNNLLVVYDANGTGLPFSSSNNIYQQDQNMSDSVYGVIALMQHTNGGTSIGNVTSTGDWFIGKNGAIMTAFGVSNTPSLIMNNNYASQVAHMVSVTTSVVDNGSQFVASGGDFLEYAAANQTVTLNNTLICTTNSPYGGPLNIENAANSTLNINGGVTYLDTGKGWNVISDNNGEGTANVHLNINNHIFGGPGQYSMNAYDFTGSGGVFTGGTAGNANSYSTGFGFMIFNNVQYNSLAAWKAAVTPQDAVAVSIAPTVGQSACTLPTIPTVN
jgi:hypothetical protein